MNIVITRFPYESQLGGMETFVLQLAKELRKRGHTISFIGNCPILLQLFSANNFKTTRFWFPKSPVTKKSVLFFFLLYPLILLQCKRIIQSLQKGDVLYMLSLAEKLTMTKYAVRKHISVFWGEHEAVKDSHNHFKKWLYRNPFLPLFQRNSAIVQKIITVSHMLKSQFQEIPLIKNIGVIPNGIDSKFFNVATVSTRAYPNRFVIGTACRIHKDKGLEYILQCIDRLKTLIPSILCVIVGDGPYKRTLEQFIQKKQLQPYVILQGETPYEQIHTVYQTFDIGLYLSSAWETFGLSPLENMAVKKPVILSPFFGCITPEIKHHFLVIEPEKTDRIVQTIHKLYSDTTYRTSVIEQQCSILQTTYSFDQMVKSYENLFSKSC